MSVHPQFNKDSSCLNCAAFVPIHQDKPDRGGHCYRHAPRPFPDSVEKTIYDESGDEIGTQTSVWSDFVTFPRMVDVMFCCEWIPGFPEEKKA